VAEDAGRFPGPDEVPEGVRDPARLAEVLATRLLDTAPEESFDELAALAATVTDAPLAFITIVDDVRSYWKSAVGLPDLDRRERQNPVSESFCKYLIAAGGPVSLDDVRADERVRDNPSVAKLGIGAWAGHPIRGPEGHVVGGLCVIDPHARVWTERDTRTLAGLARAISAEIALRQARDAAEKLAEQLRVTGQATADLARDLQQSLLPPVLPEIPGLQVASAYVPSGSTEVLGDFYDLFPAQDGWYCAVLGDVCGKGVEAAKVTAMARYTIRAEATQPVRPSPSAVLGRLNDAMLAQLGHMNSRFLTAAYVSFAIGPGGVLNGRICLAGHPPGLVRRGAGQVEEIGAPGTLIGVWPDPRLTDVPVHLEPGDTLVLYTDGITEARPTLTRRIFGERRLAQLLATSGDLDASATIELIARAADTHANGAARDDTALLALRVPLATSAVRAEATGGAAPGDWRQTPGQVSSASSRRG
jgi:serine phosphatase RsbU (regulator of sigma subunit)